MRKNVRFQKKEEKILFPKILENIFDVKKERNVKVYKIHKFTL